MRVLLFGPLRDVAGWRERTLAEPSTTLSALRAQLTAEDAALGAALASPGVQVAVDKAVVRGDAPLSAGVEVAFLPPMSGGVTMRVALTPDRIDPAALLGAFTTGCGARTGGVVSFIGLCRREPDETGLELEAFPGFTEPAIEAFLDAAIQRFGLDQAQAVHRVGLVSPGQPIVFVAAAAAHRRAAFQGADCIMDWLKSRAPFWKKAHTAAGGHWIEPRPQDYDDAGRWDEPLEERSHR